MELRTKPLTLQRLRSMSLTEMAYRGHQEAVKAFERFAPARRAADADEWARAHAPSLADSDVALQVVRDLAPRRFFAGAAEASTSALLRERFPEECERIVATAGEALAGRLDLLGYRGLSFGVPIDWHLDPVWWKRAPLTHWSRLNPLDAATVGDSKVVWELNRHQWLVRLAQAWVVTRDTRYASACIEQFYAWFEANPAGMGINWTSSLEASYRLMSWSWMMLLIRDWPGLTNRCVRDVLVSVWQHATFVRRHLSYYFSPNTHLTGEALGLVHAGLVFPFYREASDWRAVGLRVLVEECRRQVHADGVHFEQSTCYQRYSAETYLTLLALAARNAIVLPREVTEQTARMVGVLAALQRPDGTMPAIGDADGGHLLPIAHRGPADSRGTCALGAAMFGRADVAWSAGGVAPELLWIFGRDGLRRFEALRPEPPADALRVFPSGYAVMRYSAPQGTHQLTADAGPLGCPASSGHGHADLLSVQLSIFGDPCLVDAGTGSYTPEPQWRDYFRGTAAHSTVRVDRLDQAEPAGPFKWHQRPSAHLRAWRSDADADVIDAGHDAYSRLADPVACRRRVIFVKPGYWLVVDDLQGQAEHQIDVTFQFAPDVRIVSGPEPWIRAETRGGHTLWMLPAASTRVETVICCGELDPPRGWVSSDYGQREPAPAVVFNAAARLPWRAMTILVPVAGATALDPEAVRPPALATLHDAHGWPTGVRFNAPLRSVHFTDESVTVE